MTGVWHDAKLNQEKSQCGSSHENKICFICSEATSRRAILMVSNVSLSMTTLLLVSSPGAERKVLVMVKAEGRCDSRIATGLEEC